MFALIASLHTYKGNCMLVKIMRNYSQYNHSKFLCLISRYYILPFF